MTSYHRLNMIHLAYPFNNAMQSLLFVFIAEALQIEVTIHHDSHLQGVAGFVVCCCDC